MDSQLEPRPIHDWTIIGTGIDNDLDQTVSCAYTVGLAKHVGYEVIMTGLPIEKMALTLNQLGHMIVEGFEPPLGEPLDDLVQPPYRPVLMEMGAEHDAAWATSPLRQLCWPDEHELMPWEEDVDPLVFEIQSIRGRMW